MSALSDFSAMRRVADDLLRCPICMETPSAEIYQCRNGHHICRRCGDAVTSCPSCRVGFEVPKIRNRGMEALIENMEVECPNKREGCQVTLVKRDVGTHAQVCAFKPLKFCHEIGLQNCNFATSDREKIVDHLRDQHGVLVVKGESFNVVDQFWNFVKAPQDYIGSPIMWISDLYTGPAWSNQKHACEQFLTILSISPTMDDCGLTFLFFGIPETMPIYKATIQIIDDSTHTSKLLFQMLPLWYKDVGSSNDDVQHPQIKIRLAYLSKILQASVSCKLQSQICREITAQHNNINNNNNNLALSPPEPNNDSLLLWDEDCYDDYVDSMETPVGREQRVKASRDQHLRDFFKTTLKYKPPSTGGVVPLFKLASAKGYDEYLKAIGMGKLHRDTEQKGATIIEFRESGGRWSVKTLPTFKTTEINFALGKEFDEKLLDGRIVKTRVTWVGSKLCKMQKFRGFTAQTTYEFFVNNKEIRERLTVNGISATRIFRQL